MEVYDSDQSDFWKILSITTRLNVFDRFEISQNGFFIFGGYAFDSNDEVHFKNIALRFRRGRPLIYQSVGSTAIGLSYQ